MSLYRDPGLFFDRDGQPIDMLEWSRKLEDRDYSVIAQHWVRGWMVSTVWLGIDHGLNPFSTGPPIIFETMIFAPGDVRIAGDDDLDRYQERYATVDAAQAGHDRALAATMERLGGDAAGDVISAAEFTDQATAPDDPSSLLRHDHED